MTIEEPTEFHRRVAEELTRRYDKREQAPADWRETLAWHWEQAGAYAEAANSTLEIAEARMSRLDFTSALTTSAALLGFALLFSLAALWRFRWDAE